ncbi:MAG: hypothetical protein ACRCYO_19590, partial [Bacteroidia bacterium]
SLKKMGIDLIIAFVPGKPTLLPEFLPRSANRFKRKTTNYELFAAACREKSLNCIDYTAFFKEYQLISDYPIFPRHGSHLSFYAECIVVDSTIRYIENLTGRDLPDFTRSKLRTQTIPKFRDQDIWLKAQRYCLNQTQELAYESPISYEADSGFMPTRVLGIGDSYYRCFYYTNAMSEAFANGPYWYYFNTQISDDAINPEVWEQDLRLALQKNQVVVIMANDANLTNLGNGFIDEAYMMFQEPKAYAQFVERKRKSKQAIRKIRKDELLMRKLTMEAQQSGLTMDSILRREALKIKPN